MNRRLVLAVIAVGLLVTTAGCSGVFSGISDEQLDRDQEYDDLRGNASDADVTIDVEGGNMLNSGEFRAVYDLDGTEELSLSQSTLFSEQALDIHSVRYWYPNGTEVTGSELDIEQSRSSTEIRVPDEDGTLAFSGEAGRKTFSLPAYVEGSHEVRLPENHRTTNFLFGDVSPNGYEREIVDDEERLYWEEVENEISVRYYLARDVPLFIGLIGTVALIGGAGIAYYYREVKRLRKEREEMGLNVDIDDDSNDGPPPGMG
ncbi:hypothetical protein HT576_09260 [Haloterrigena sp. SYSU A121-1]|uniref:Uncharacterized protein n=1 Tax=Haloterrigena gelatinilytica TaxID=2741724 RepID=A0A8J8GJL6_9EURY|nr:DUF5803 family protein [Haloterrigena gelatinilytica]NUB91208.1 hypothetical protein [Haloterrigena gelatinilytica]